MLLRKPDLGKREVWMFYFIGWNTNMYQKEISILEIMGRLIPMNRKSDNLKNGDISDDIDI